MKFLKNPNGINRIKFLEILALAVGSLIIIPILTIVIYTFSQESFVMLAVALLSLGIFMTVLSTWFALNKYLRMSIDDLYS